MSANAEVVVGALREEDAQLYVINLCASTTPVALTQPNSPELKRYTFFVTRRREEGRERFRLHMGYFTSIEDAQALLADVREVYPAAWAGPAPGNSKPSPRMAAVPVPPKPPVAEAPVAEAPEAPLELTLVEDQPREPRQASSLDTSLGDMSNVREVLAALDDRPATKAAASVSKPVAAKAADVLRPIVAPKIPPAPAAPAVTLTPKQELSLLESGAPLKDLDDSAIRMMTPEDTQTLRDIKLDSENKAPPCFAVQLMWSVTPIDMATLPQLAIFNAYTLYNVEGSRQGRRWYGVRLGFFTDVNAAKQVAYFMKADYKSVVVVPVTVKERARASDEGESTAASPVVAKPQAPAPKAGSGSFELLSDDKSKTASAGASSPTVQTPVMDPALDFAPVGMTPVTPVTPVTSSREAQAGPAPSGAKLNRPGGAPPGKLPPQGGKKPTGKRVVARGRRAEPGQAAPLEETLELLGASTLTLDEDKKTVIDDSALRRSADAGRKKPGGLRFSKLLGRLSEKLGDSRR
jgi:hypothetical protein